MTLCVMLSMDILFAVPVITVLSNMLVKGFFFREFREGSRGKTVEESGAERKSSWGSLDRSTWRIYVGISQLLRDRPDRNRKHAALYLSFKCVSPYPTHGCCWGSPPRGPSNGIQTHVRAGPCVLREVISACFGCPSWKLACWHIFLQCFSERLVTMKPRWVVSHSGEKERASPSREGLSGTVKVKGEHSCTILSSCKACHM